MTGSSRIWIMGLFLGAACSRGQRPAVIDSAQNRSGPLTVPAADARVDPLAQDACLTGDSLLRRIPGTTVTRLPATPFDSLWHESPDRWACHVAAIGRLPSAYAEIDSMRTWLKARGAADTLAPI